MCIEVFDLVSIDSLGHMKAKIEAQMLDYLLNSARVDEDDDKLEKDCILLLHQQCGGSSHHG